MIKIDIKMPDTCKDCFACVWEEMGEYCSLDAKFDFAPKRRPKDCPLQEMESKTPIKGDPKMDGFKFICGNCHWKVERNHRYCPHCGNPIDWGI